MIIDIHTHIFPDKIADLVLANSERSLDLPAKAKGTEKSLRNHMDEIGVEVSIVLAVSPEARLVKKTNDWLLSIQDQRLKFFGTIHPDLPDWEQEIARLNKENVKGIKFNALLQEIRPDDKRMFPIYDEMAEKGMIALFHSGSSYKQRHELSKVVATPERIGKVIDAFPNLKVIAAHYGGNHMLEQMEEHLLGRDLYIDTSYPPNVYALDPRRIVDIIHRHGAERVLFGTDYPWETQDRGISYVRGLALSEKEKEGILGENAKKLLFDGEQKIVSSDPQETSC